MYFLRGSRFLEKALDKELKCPETFLTPIAKFLNNRKNGKSGQD